MKKCIWDIVKINQPDPKPVPGVSEWIISGVTESVDIDAGTITLWLNGSDKFHTVPIDPKMPGWMLAPNMAFRTTIPRGIDKNDTLEGVVWGEFLTQCYVCKSEDELLEDLSRFFSAIEKRLS